MVETISFGRPVLPPDVGAFSEGETRAGAVGGAVAGRLEARRDRRAPGGLDADDQRRVRQLDDRLQLALGQAGRDRLRDAPSFQAASVASKNSMPFGSPMVTKSPGADTQLRVRAGEPVGAPVELRAGDGPALVRDRGPVGARQRPVRSAPPRATSPQGS